MKQMKNVAVTLGMVLGWLVAPGSAQAGIITSGIWSPATPGAFYDGVSDDCATCGIGFLLADSSFWWGGDITNLEYLHDADGQPVSFWYFNETDSIELGLIYVPPEVTWWIFSYSNSSTGHSSNSIDSYWQWVMFRTLSPYFADTPNPEDWMYLYLLGVEDTPRSEGFGDRDYNELVFSFAFDSPGYQQPVEGSTPELSSLLLFGLGLVAVRRRLVRRE